MAQNATGGTRYISDETAVTLRAEKGMRGEVVALIKSGTRVDLVEHDAASGYSRVRVGPGREGWVLTRYLSEQPAARERLAEVEAELAAAQARIEELEAKPLPAPEPSVAPEDVSAPADDADTGAGRRYGLSEMLTGGGLFVAGLLLGLIFNLLPRKGRRRRWTPEL